MGQFQHQKIAMILVALNMFTSAYPLEKDMMSEVDALEKVFESYGVDVCKPSVIKIVIKFCKGHCFCD